MFAIDNNMSFVTAQNSDILMPGHTLHISGIVSLNFSNEVVTLFSYARLGRTTGRCRRKNNRREKEKKKKQILKVFFSNWISSGDGEFSVCSTFIALDKCIRDDDDHEVWSVYIEWQFAVAALHMRD